MDEDALIVRVRGTFIDFGTNLMKTMQRNRSSSVPSRNLEHHELVASGQCRYVNWLMDRADELPRFHERDLQVASSQDHTPVRRHRSGSVHSKSWEKAEAEACSCGEAFVPQASFCHRCGMPRSIVASSNTDFAFGAADDFGDSTTPGSDSDSSDTLPSLGSCDRLFSNASTIDSFGDQLSPQSSWQGSPKAHGMKLSSSEKRWSDLDVECEQEEELWAEDTTTLMIADIPCRQTIQQLIEAMNGLGFEGTYDLVYMPPQKGYRRQNHAQNMGYAFVNFKEPQYASSFAQSFHNFTFPHCYSSKLSYTKPARCQGLEANLAMHSKQRSPGCLITFA